MNFKDEFEAALGEISAGMALPKCQQCGCMRETLDPLQQVLPILPEEAAADLQDKLPRWLNQMKPVRYACLGCEHCYAGAAQNAFTAAFPQTADSFGLSCEIQLNEESWPPVVGEYCILNKNAPVAVVTLASLELAGKIASGKPGGLAIVGKLETENIGIDKLVKNVNSNPSLRYLLIAGIESVGHQSGQALLALAENGVDESGRIIGARGKRPVLRNVTREEVEAFRSQVQLLDLIGCEDLGRIESTIENLSDLAGLTSVEVEPCGCAGDT